MNTVRRDVGKSETWGAVGRAGPSLSVVAWFPAHSSALMRADRRTLAWHWDRPMPARRRSNPSHQRARILIACGVIVTAYIPRCVYSVMNSYGSVLNDFNSACKQCESCQNDHSLINTWLGLCDRQAGRRVHVLSL